MLELGAGTGLVGLTLALLGAEVERPVCSYLWLKQHCMGGQCPPLVTFNLAGIPTVLPVQYSSSFRCRIHFEPSRGC